MGKKCNHKVGDLVYFTSKHGADNQYCIITYIEELTSYNTVGSYESWEKKIWGAWKDSIDKVNEGSPSGWMPSSKVFHVHGYQSPLWKVLNGESIEGEE